MPVSTRVFSPVLSRRFASYCRHSIGDVVRGAHLLSGIAATGDDGNTANLEELHFGVGRVVKCEVVAERSERGLVAVLVWAKIRIFWWAENLVP